jgi:hypothetical protein
MFDVSLMTMGGSRTRDPTPCDLPCGVARDKQIPQEVPPDVTFIGVHAFTPTNEGHGQSHSLPGHNLTQSQLEGVLLVD